MMNWKSLALPLLAATILSACQSTPSTPSQPNQSSALVPFEYGLPGGNLLSGFGTLRGDELIVDRDMVLPKSAIKSSTRVSARANIGGAAWPKAIVWYSFDPAVTADVRQKVIAAMQPWSAIGIRFSRLGTKPPSGYVTITTAALPQYQWVCYASVGYAPTVYPPPPSSPTKYYAGSACRTHDYVHEWGHILGLLHETQRSDRDQYVITTEASGGTIGGQAFGAYDFNSIMHYDAYVRNEDGSINYNVPPVIVPRDGRPLNSFGFTETLSAGDVQFIEYLYPSRFNPIPW
jgi:Astacin (Peptidase family M12A)